jgi:hypothetical protein
VVLAIEIVSAETFVDDWFRTPARYAAAGVSCFWRVEAGIDDRPIVYEHWLDQESGVYVPTANWGCAGTFTTTVPFPVRIELRGPLSGYQW